MREMRRKRQALGAEEIRRILERNTCGVLAVTGEEGFPYAVPLSYTAQGDKIYFHCAKTGHKVDAIRQNAKVSFCVVDQDQIVPEKYTTYFRSVIAFGTAAILEDEAQIRQALESLGQKYAPGESAEHLHAEIEKELPAVCMIEMTVEHITGKEAIELKRRAEAEAK